MATSGTVAKTVIDTVLVIDHAVRRCGKIPSELSPENLDTALINLHLILSSISNRGINLWCVDSLLQPLYDDQIEYMLPEGTIDLTNVMYRTPFLLNGAVIQESNQWTTAFTELGFARVNTIGVRFASAGPYNLAIEASSDGVNYESVTSVPTAERKSGEWLWLDLPKTFTATFFRVRELAGNATFLNTVYATDVRESTVMPFSRDTYTSLPNKMSAGVPLNYFFEKQVIPKITYWPKPSEPFGHIRIWRTRQVMDVGSMSQKLELPDRWFECIIWMLAKNLSFELSGVAADRIQLCVAMADKYLLEAENAETDSSPIFISPNIRGYTA